VTDAQSGIDFGWTPSEGRAPASRRGHRTRDRILEAAVSVFEERGLVDVTMQEIGQRAGLSSGTVYKYFRDKADIFRFLLTQLRQTIRDETTILLDDDGKLVVRPAVSRFLELYRDNVALYRVWWESLDPPNEFSDVWVEVHEGYRKGFVAAFKRGRRTGVTRPDLDVELLAELAVLLFERPTYSRIVLGWDSEVEDDQVSAVTAALLGSGLGVTVTE
jgi:AcrR family transcriptional regulator